jgi:hypothetical protein
VIGGISALRVDRKLTAGRQNDAITPLRTFSNAWRCYRPATVGRQHASGTRPVQANLICFASLAVPSDLASSHRTEGVFMACRTRTKFAVTGLIGARIDVEYASVGEVLA